MGKHDSKGTTDANTDPTYIGRHREKGVVVEDKQGWAVGRGVRQDDGYKRAGE